MKTMRRKQESGGEIPSIRVFVRNKPIFSPERILRKDYVRKGSVEEKVSGRVFQGALFQD